MTKTYLIYPKILKGEEALGWQMRLEHCTDRGIKGDKVDGIIKCHARYTLSKFCDELTEVGVEK